MDAFHLVTQIDTWFYFSINNKDRTYVNLCHQMESTQCTHIKIPKYAKGANLKFNFCF